MRHVWHLAAALTVATALAQPTAHAQFARQEIISFQSAKLSPTDFLNAKKGEKVNPVRERFLKRIAERRAVLEQQREDIKVTLSELEALRLSRAEAR